MENLDIKETYLQRRAEQLRQWDRVIDRLKSRANQAKGGRKTELNHHVIKIQVKKARTEVKLRQLKEAGNEKWNYFKSGLEKSWAELRQAFLKASAKPR